MAYGLTLVFEGLAAKDYWAVNDRLGIARDGSGDWPAGLTSHTGAETADGFVVSEVWVDKDAHQKFMAERLGPALGAVGVKAPSQMIEANVINHHTPAS